MKTIRWHYLLNSSYTPWILIFIGTLLRLRQYFYNKSLWLDEAIYALNILHRNFIGLTKPLDFGGIAPIGFLWIEKAITQVLGTSEFSLRLIPFLCSVVGVYLLYKVSRMFLSKTYSLVALCLFVLNVPLIYYASEVNKYSSDVVTTLLAYLVLFSFFQKKLWSIKDILALIIFGVLLIWFSYTAIFTLSGLAIVLLLVAYVRHDRKKLTALVTIGLFWLASFILNFFVNVGFNLNNSQVVKDWSYQFTPNVLSVSFLPWAVTSFVDIFKLDLYLDTPFFILGMIFFIAGIQWLYKNDKIKLLFLLGPVITTLVVSLFHYYFFYERLILFLVPSFILIIAFGAQKIIRIALAKKDTSSRVIAAILFILLFINPLYKALQSIGKPFEDEDIKPVLKYFSLHRRIGDILYLYYASQYAYLYYAPRYGLENQKYVIGVDRTDNLNEYAKDLDRLKGNKRMWLLASHGYSRGKVDEVGFFLEYLHRIGRPLDHFEATNAGVFLFDLNTTL